MGMLRGTLTLLNRESGEIFIEAAHGLSESQKEREDTDRGGGDRKGSENRPARSGASHFR